MSRVPEQGVGAPAAHGTGDAVSAVPASIPDAWGPIEYDDGYPADEEFGAFDDVALDLRAAAHWMLSELPRAAENMPCFCSIGDGVDAAFGTTVKLIEFSTGGWSGAESIVGLIKRRFDMNSFMVSWRRGGHFVFEIPVRLLDTQP